MQTEIERPEKSETLSIDQFIEKSGVQHVFQLHEHDEGEIVPFFDSVGMASGGFKILMKRQPRFFDLLKHRGGISYAFGVRDRAGNLSGVGAMTSTVGYINRKLENVAYMGDLRVGCPDREIRREWKTFLGYFMKNSTSLAGVGKRAKIVSAILETNDRARAALEEKSFHGQRLKQIASYAMITIWGKKPFTKNDIRYKVENGAPLEELEDFLDSVHNKQAFGSCFLDPHYELRRRFQDWAHFSSKDFFVARDEAGKIIATTALWNPNHCKQVVVEGPWWTKFINPIAKFFSLPQFGKPIEIIYMTHLNFDWSLGDTQRQSAMHSLMDSIWSEKKKRNAHAFAFCDFKGHSVLPAVKNYITSSTKVGMYLSVPEEEFATFDPSILGYFPPAFEMALV
ncbi:MAG: hypothetical protein AB7O96_16165 [Pseudobdellovibrionaceae bacterium]